MSDENPTVTQPEQPTPTAEQTPPPTSLTGPQKPSPGRVVHYVLPEHSGRTGEHRAAVITSGWDGPSQNLTIYLDQNNDVPQEKVDCGDLCNLYLIGPMVARAWSIPYSETATPGSWHWPERV